MANVLSFSNSELLALFFESVLYGVYLVFSTDCIKVLINKRRRRAYGNLRLILPVISTTLFLLITWHQFIDTIRLYMAYKDSETNDGVDLYYFDVTSMLSVMKTSVYLIETLLSDLFILYRCYVVWNSNIFVIILPILLYIADAGTGIAAVWTLSQLTEKQSPLFSLKQERITISFFSCTLAVNTVCTGLIASRIWRMQRQTRDAEMRANFWNVSIIVIESGSIYLTVLACNIAALMLKSNMFNIFLDITSPIIGIVFTLIIVRVGRGVSSEDTRCVDTMQSISLSMPSRTSAGNTSRSNGAIAFATTTATQFTDAPDSEHIHEVTNSQGPLKMDLDTETDSY